ncbi:MAG: DUF5711 family protein [Acutalibacteraceae bacterium]
MTNTEKERAARPVKVIGRKKQKKILLTLIVIISVALLAFTAFYVAPHVRNGTKQAQSDKSQEENEALLFTSGSEIIGGIHLSSGDIVVTANSLISFKSNGEKRYSTSIGYSNPVFKSADSKYIVFERSTGKYTIADRSKIIYQNDLDEEIINCDIASNGNYAIITRSAQSTLLVTVYSSKNKALFGWECSDDYLIDVALSKNGNSVAVSSVNVRNGEQYSRIYYFNIDSLKVENKIEYPNETVYKIKFIDNKRVGVITDISYMIADMDETKSEVLSYEDDKIAGFSYGQRSTTAILKKKFGSLNEKSLMIVNKKCEKVFEEEIESDVLDFTSDGNKAYILISGTVLIYSISSGEKIDGIPVNGSVEKLLVSGKNLYALSDNGVYKYRIK